MKTNKLYIVPILLTLFLVSCRDAFEIESIDFQNSLVVEATITNELKKHVIKLSRTYELNLETQISEDNATVTVEASDGNTYNFTSLGESIYQSELEFQAMPNVTYSLNIITADGERFQSSSSVLASTSEITELYGELTLNDRGEEGVQFYIDSENQDNSTGYFRYEYEETYQVVAPFYYPFTALLTDYFDAFNDVPGPIPNLEAFYNVTIVPRSQEEGICYSSNQQKGIIVTTTNNLTNDNVVKFPIRFINKENAVLRDRYSIKVRQYGQSIESYTYYETLDNLGNVDNILSQSQPGFVFGNINSLSNPSINVIGFFDVSSISEKRIFVDYADFDIPQPDYLYECDVRILEFNDNTVNDGDRNERIAIYVLLTRFMDENSNYEIAAPPTPNTNGTWTLVNPECGNCTSVSSNIRPDFWID